MTKLTVFRSDEKSERIIEAERLRLVDAASGSFIAKSTAIRSLIYRQSELVDAT